jgi:hypothetical protein
MQNLEPEVLIRLDLSNQKFGGPRKFDPTLDPSSFYFFENIHKTQNQRIFHFANKKYLDLEPTILLKIKN